MQIAFVVAWILHKSISILYSKGRKCRSFVYSDRLERLITNVLVQMDQINFPMQRFFFVPNVCCYFLKILHNLAIKLMTPLFLCRKIVFLDSFLLFPISFLVISDGLNLKLEIAIQDNTYSNCSKIISVVKTTFPACSCISSDKTLTLVLI